MSEDYFDKQRLIVGQCSFKGAIDLCVAGLIELDEIDSFTETKTDMIMKLGQKVSYKYPKEVKAPATQSASAEFFCPACKSKLYDNRETKTGNQPSWKCYSKTCTAGKEYMGKRQPWASWSESPTAEMQKDFVPPTPPTEF